MAPNEGGEEFARVIEERKLSHIEVERALKLHEGGGYVGRLISGDRTPSLELSARIEDLYGVRSSSWLRLKTAAKVA